MIKKTPFLIGFLILTLSFPFPTYSVDKDIAGEIKLRINERDLLEKDMAFAVQEFEYWKGQAFEKRLVWGIGAGIGGGSIAAAILYGKYYLQKRRERLAEAALSKVEMAAAIKKLGVLETVPVVSVVKPVAEAMVKKFGLRKVVIVVITAGIFAITTESIIELDSSEDDIFERFIQRGTDFQDSDEYFIREVLDYVSSWTSFRRPSGVNIANHNIEKLDSILEQVNSAIYEMDRSKERRDLKYAETMAALYYAKNHVIQRKYNLLSRDLNDYIRRVKDARHREKKSENKNESLSKPLVEPAKDNK